MTRRFLLLAAAAAPLLACRPLSEEQAVKVVRAYNGAVIEGLRSGDARLIDPVTGPEEGRKLTGLIGVKLDQGITMDAQLLEFQVLGVERDRDGAIVSTEERWHYLERRIGSGEQVGPDSRDHYFMRYYVRRPEKRWVVDRIEYAKPPEVGRKEIWSPADVQAGGSGKVGPGPGGTR